MTDNTQKKGFSFSLCLSTTKDSPTARIRHTKKQREIVPRGGNLRVISIECWFFPRGRNTQTYLSAELGQLNSPEKRQRNEKKLISRIISTRLRRAVKKAAAWNHLEGAQYWFSIVWAFEGVNSACTSCHQLRRPLQRWDLHDRARESMVHRPFLQPNQKSVCSLKKCLSILRMDRWPGRRGPIDPNKWSTSRCRWTWRLRDGKTFPPSLPSVSTWAFVFSTFLSNAKIGTEGEGLSYGRGKLLRGGKKGRPQPVEKKLYVSATMMMKALGGN